MTTKLSLQTFGGLALQVDEKPITNLASRKAEALLVYLVIEQRPIPREFLADLFWDDRSQAQAMGNLRVVLSSLHKQLPAFVDITRTTAGINPQANVWIDVLALQTAFESGPVITSETINMTAQALAHYRGEFLAGFSVHEACGFEAWQVHQRTHYHELARELTHRLLRYHEDHHRVQDGIEVAHRWLALDPLDEAAARQMMRFKAQLGQRDTALAEFATTRRRLKQEMGLEPEPATLALAEAIRTGKIAPPFHEGPPAPGGMRHNLPPQQTALIGREQELAQLAELLAQPDTHLVTIVAAGGMGKTRLALAAAALQFTAGLYQDGVFLVALAALSQPSGMVPALAEAIQFPFHSSDSRPLRQQVLDYLARRQMLLILDNFEHLLDGVDLVEEILNVAPRVKLLVTSREPLRLYAEQRLPLAGLAFTRSGVQAEDAAAQLFLRRARAFRPGLVMGKEDWLHLTTICHQVGGMPLGLEMAAAWADALPLAHIAADLSQSLDLLETDLRDVPERQRSMRAVFDASWQRLNEVEQQTFAYLSVFRGGFTVDAAAAVCTPPTNELVFRRLLASLTHKSLLNYDAAADRYQLHELMRQYGDEKLKANPAETHLIQDRHSAYYCAFLHAHTDDWYTTQQIEAMTAMTQEAGNVQVAWQWAVTHAEWQRMAQAMLSMSEYHERRGRVQDGVAVYQAIIDLMAEQANRSTTVDPDCLRLWAHALALKAGIDLDYQRAMRDVQQSLDLLARPELADQDIRRERANALFVRGLRMWLFKENLPEVQQLFEQSLALFQELHDEKGCAWVWLYASGVDWAFGNYDQALSRVKASLAIWQKLGTWACQFRCLNQLGVIQRNLGQLAEAERLAREAVAVGELLGEHAGGIYGSLALTLLWCGKLDEAYQLAAATLTIAQDQSNRRVESEGYYRLAEILLHQGQYQLAGKQAHKGLSIAQSIGIRPTEGYVYGVLGQLALVELSWAEAQTFFAQCTAILTQRQLGFYDVALSGLGYSACLRDQPEEAQRHLVKALSEGLALKAYWPVLFALAGVALFLAKWGNAARAVEVWAVAQAQPLVAHSRWFAEVVGERVNAAAISLPPTLLTTIQAQAQTSTFWEIAQTLAQELQQDDPPC